MFKRIALFFVIFNLGCYKNHLYVQQEKVDRNFLASTHVHTPDPRQEHPPQGQKLLIGWNFPLSLVDQDLTLKTTVRLWNQTEQFFTHPVEGQRGYTTYYFPNDLSEEGKKILTYRVQVFSKEGTLIETWEHHFWTELIDVDTPESFSSPQSRSSSVSSHPKQASVIETP